MMDPTFLNGGLCLKCQYQINISTSHVVLDPVYEETSSLPMVAGTLYTRNCKLAWYGLYSFQELSRVKCHVIGKLWRTDNGMATAGTPLSMAEVYIM